MRLGFEDSLLVGYDFSERKERTLLIVSRKTDRGMEVINCLEKEKAEKLYDFLTGKVDFK